jgi:hypothetical protein
MTLPLLPHDFLGLVQLAGVAFGAGVIVEALFDTGATPFLLGIGGILAGAGLGALGWSPGPALGDIAVVPALLGTLLVGGFVKLAALGSAGPRW